MIKTNLPAVTPLTPTVTQTSIKFCFNVTSFAEVSDISYVIYNEATPTEPVETGTVLAVGSFWPYGMEVNVEKEELEYNSGTYVCELTATNENGSTTATQRATLEKYIDWAEPESVVSGNRFMADGVEEIGTLPEKTSVDVTVDGLTVTVPAGAYQESVEVTTEPEPVYDWLCFTAYTDNSTVALTTTTQSAESVTLYKSTDQESWTAWDGSAITLQNTGDKVWIYGDNNNTMENHRFVITGSVTCSGDMLTLLKRDGDVTFLPTRCFSRLFQDCAGLQSFEKLPALTGSSSYTFLFYGCTALASAPLMPATTLAQSCYDSMFSECTSLSSAPTLPATTLAQSCYSGMFEGCTALTQAPELPATTLADYCYYQMFWNCTSLTTAPVLPATTMAQNCYAQMFQGCTSLSAAPSLNATTIAANCYQSMFSGCISLTTAPELPATTLASSCYSGMFRDCTSLTTAPELPATTLYTYCYQNMFYCCTALTTMPTLAATTMMRSSYQGMFRGCTALTTVTDLVATTLARSCYQDMFSGCTALTVSPVLADATMEQDCYKQMFAGCTLLEEITTNLTAWNTSNSTNWVRDVASTGTFYNNGGATIPTGTNGIPTGWTEQRPFVNYFWIQLDNSDTQIGLRQWNDPCEGSITPTFPNLEYSLDDGATWTQISENDPTPSELHLNEGDKVLFRGNNSQGMNPGLDQNPISDYSYIWNFYSDDNISIGGDIRSLLYGSNFENVQVIPAYAFAYLFSNSSVTDASALELNGSTVGAGAFREMFNGCTSLTTAPATLPATTIGNYCYQKMFNGCTSLTTAPATLPATTLAEFCYDEMFAGCTSLTTSPAIYGEDPSMYTDCYNRMFFGCSSLNRITVYAQSFGNSANWVNGVAATGDFYNLGGAEIWSGNRGIPSGWTEHTSI